MSGRDTLRFLRDTNIESPSDGQALIFQSSSNKWIASAGAQGATGITGAQGAQGAQGVVGAQGAQGSSAGATGNTWTPTITNLGGLTGTPTSFGLFQQIGDVVSVSLKVTGLASNGAQGIKTLQSDVPVKTGNFGNANQAFGPAVMDLDGTTNEDLVGTVDSVASNQRVILRFLQLNGVTGIDQISASFQYHDN